MQKGLGLGLGWRPEAMMCERMCMVHCCGWLGGVFPSIRNITGTDIT